ncbi:hypothetical protein FGLOB1_422 [Fusarium globosum]|uniref:Uncharacterized protein n=1 Tax=Fusarium globosum TaxID=78864 RepID=A0A8H6DL51_9HYPO|nr:hypothetical protein FGLOB1_422 [Fusarium globosum]
MELYPWPEGNPQAQGELSGFGKLLRDISVQPLLSKSNDLSEWHLQDNEFLQATSDTLDTPSEFLYRKLEELLELKGRLKKSRTYSYYSIRNDFTSGHLAQTYSSGAMDYMVKALVGPNRYKIDALPDTGAKRNFVSQQLVESLGLVPKDRTLTKLAHRITKSLGKFAPRFRFNLIEDDTCCLQGSFDDIPSIALADTGCDAMLISADFARRHSLEIDKGVEHRHLVEYADGSLDTTTGIIRDSTWQLRSSRNKIPCDFYVLDDLKADIVLSSHFIFQHEIFSQFEGDVIDMSLIPERDFGDLYNIRLISHYSSVLRSLEASSIADMNSPGLFSPGAIKAERVRRDQIRDAINALPLEQQDQARIDERNRQEIWDGYRRRHLEKQEENTNSAKQVLVAQKERWWEKGLVWRRFGRRAT